MPDQSLPNQSPPDQSLPDQSLPDQSLPDQSPPDQPRPLGKEQAPNPAHTYERTDPGRESGAGRLTNNANATPTHRPDKMAAAVHHAQDGSKQLNAEEAATSPPKAEVKDGEESLGWEKKKRVE